MFVPVAAAQAVAEFDGVQAARVGHKLDVRRCDPKDGVDIDPLPPLCEIGQTDAG